MTDKTYKLENGIVLDTEAEVKAYIRGLELARVTSEGCTEGRTEFLSKMAAQIEEANAVKNKGPTNFEGKTDAEVEADEAKKAAEIEAATKKAAEEEAAQKQAEHNAAVEAGEKNEDEG